MLEEIVELEVGPNGGLAKDASFDMVGFKNTLKLRAELEGGDPNADPWRYIDLSYYERRCNGCSLLIQMAGQTNRFRDCCAIVGVGQSRLGKVPELSSSDLLLRAIKDALDEAASILMKSTAPFVVVRMTFTLTIK